MENKWLEKTLENICITCYMKDSDECPDDRDECLHYQYQAEELVRIVKYLKKK